MHLAGASHAELMETVDADLGTVRHVMDKGLFDSMLIVLHDSTAHRSLSVAVINGDPFGLKGAMADAIPQINVPISDTGSVSKVTKG